jgi:hypothetical protein
LEKSTESATDVLFPNQLQSLSSVFLAMLKVLWLRESIIARSANPSEIGEITRGKLMISTQPITLRNSFKNPTD